MSRPDRLAMVDGGHASVSVRRQCALLGVARAGVYRCVYRRKLNGHYDRS